jgi:replicative DNA helicase
MVRETPGDCVTDLKLIKEKIESGEISPEEGAKIGAEMIATGRTYQPMTSAEKIRQYETDKARRALSQRQAIPFVSVDFDDSFRLTQGLYLVGAKSGQGKSSAAGAIIATFIENVPKRRVIMLSNEETAQVTYDRVACVMLKKNFSKYMKGRLPPSERNEVEELSYKLIDRIDVESGESKYDMSCYEDVKGVLAYAASVKDVGLILLDYHQTVTWSRDNPEQESFQVSKRLGHHLKEYGRKATVPVIDLVQLNPKDNSPDFSQRVQNDRTLYNHAYAAVEISPDFETGITKFVIHKDRYGQQQGRVIEMAFKDGRYELPGF